MISDNTPDKPTMGFAAIGSRTIIHLNTPTITSVTDQMAAEREANQKADRMAIDADERVRAAAPQLLKAVRMALDVICKDRKVFGDIFQRRGDDMDINRAIATDARDACVEAIALATGAQS